MDATLRKREEREAVETQMIQKFQNRSEQVNISSTFRLSQQNWQGMFQIYH